MLRETQSKDKVALYILYKVVDESIFEKIVGVSTSKEAWDILKKVFKGFNQVKKMCLQTLRGELEAIKIKYSKDISSYIIRVQTVVNQLKHNGETSHM